jgi:formate C-acetyltransferase
MYVNDTHVINYLAERSGMLEEARDWSMYGCSEPVASPQRHFKALLLNAACVLDVALHNGIAPSTGKRIGVETGDPRNFTTFEEVEQAFKRQLQFIYRRFLKAERLMHQVQVETFRLPLRSALDYGCIERGMSHLIGGNGAYPGSYHIDRGLIDVADSLTSIKRLVFDEKKLTMEELVETLDSNFDGRKGEEIRQMCLAAPKYGNDIDEADCAVRDVAKFSADVICSEKNMFGKPYILNRNGVSWHYSGGKGVGALPNGRKAWKPLYDGSLSPMTGKDMYGPTAVLNSAIKADYRDVSVPIINLKFPLTVLQSPEGLEKVSMLTETFIKNGGIHIQYNFLDKQTLLAAKKDPEEYKDLVVRVAGYSAYFVNLTSEVQDEIIARTEHCL